MLDLSKEGAWEEALKNDPKLKALAVEAGVEKNPERARELNGCMAWNCGHGVVQSEAEEELAIYMFCWSNPESMQRALEGRILMAKQAGIPLSDL